MANKPILTEAVAKRWAQLSRVGQKADNFLKEMYQQDQEEMEEGCGNDDPRKMEGMPGEEGMPPPEAGPEGGMPPEGGESEMPPEGGEGGVEGLVQALADVISQHTGVAIDVSGGGGGMPPEAGPEGGMPPEGGESEMPPDMGTGEEEPEMSEEMFESLAAKRGYVKKVNENEVKEEKVEEQEELEEDAYQEGKRGKPTPGKHPTFKGSIEGAGSPKTISSNDPATKPMKDLKKDPLSEKAVNELAKKIFEKVTALMEEKKLPELTKEELLAARKAKAAQKK